MLLALSWLGASCATEATPTSDPARWQRVSPKPLAGAVISIWGASERDLWAVGGDVPSVDPDGPMVLRFDGALWKREKVGSPGALWWVHGFPSGPVFLAGAGGRILKWEPGSGTFTPMPTPSGATVFGLWGASPTDLWAVGGANSGTGAAFVWHSDGVSWKVQGGLPAELAEQAAWWKVHGCGPNDVWFVGSGIANKNFGATMHWDGTAMTFVNTGQGEPLFTVHNTCGKTRLTAAVGGGSNGLIFENTGSGWKSVGPKGAPGFVGVFLQESNMSQGGVVGIATAQFGGVAFRDPTTGQWSDHSESMYKALGDDAAPSNETLHAGYIDPTGARWIVGGDITVEPLKGGLVLRYATSVVPSLLAK